MPTVLGRLRSPRLTGAPATPSPGELYYEDSSNTLLWWNGAAWVPASGSGGGVSGPYTAYTPTLSNGWVRVNGTLNGFYQQVGQTVDFRIEYLIGSSDTKGNAITFDAPVAVRPPASATITLASQPPVNAKIGLLDTSAAVRDYSHALVWITATTFRPVNSASTSGINGTTPWAWATNDWMVITGSYEAA